MKEGQTSGPVIKETNQNIVDIRNIDDIFDKGNIQFDDAICFSKEKDDDKESIKPKSTNESTEIPSLAKNIKSSSLASCPDNSEREELIESEVLVTESLLDRVEKRVWVFAEELDKKIICFTAGLHSLPETNQDSAILSSQLNNPFKQAFCLTDAL